MGKIKAVSLLKIDVLIHHMKLIPYSKMNFMTLLNQILFLIQVAQVEDKVELITYGGNMKIYRNIINISRMINMEDMPLRIIALWQRNSTTKQKIRIILAIARLKEMEDTERKYITLKKLKYQ